MLLILFLRRLPPTFAALLALAGAATADVVLVKTAEGHGLLRDGKPYFVKGGGGGSSLDSIAAAGGNSVRLWGDEKLGETLEAAQKLGLTVTAGIWLGQVRQGFDWSDAEGLAKQREHVRSVVEKYRGHPALLCWALGNEMEDNAGKNGAVWTAINSLAVMVKQLDPKHPTMTVIAEIGGEKVKNLHRLCPEIDIVGINSYAGAPSLAERYQKAGGTKPYLLTEYGPAGIWEVKRNDVAAYVEPTTTEKGETYRKVYEQAVLGAPGVCLGSYAFLWGQKQEVTATWFSMFLPDGSRLGPAEAISQAWTGNPPANRAPLIEPLLIDGVALGKPGASVRVKLSARDPEGDTLKVEWRLERDAEEYGSGGDQEAAGVSFPQAIVRGDLTGAEVRLPADGGLYRLFAFVRDGHGNAAAANIPLRVDAPITIAKGTAAKLPLRVYGEESDPANYIPAGWMGDAKLIKLDPLATTEPHTGKNCMRCEFQGPGGWGGVVWQNPAGDWGDRGAGYNLTGATKLAFWARGEQGGEAVEFKFGIIPNTKKFFDTAGGALPKVQLTKEWKRYEIPVASQDLTRIKTGFVWTTQGAGKPVVFYLDDIQWE
jgi:hypothetical protein